MRLPKEDRQRKSRRSAESTPLFAEKSEIRSVSPQRIQPVPEGIRKDDVMAQSNRRKPSQGTTAGKKETVSEPVPAESSFFTSPATSSSSKLDPLLRLGMRAPREPQILRTLAETADAIEGRSARLRNAQSVSELPVSLHTLTTGISEPSTRELAREDLVLVLVDTRDSRAATKAIEAVQGRVRSLTTTTLLVHAPRSRLAEIASHAAVDYVEASTRLRPHCDLAHASSRLIQSGVRTVRQTGRGVLVGVVDTGIDAAHPAFQNNGRTRIVDYLDQETGQQYDAAAVDAGKATASPDTHGHGTHVAGIAAGNGGGSHAQTLLGVAPEADLAIVKTTFESAHIVAGIEHIFRIADERRQPCVVNLSLGGHVGGHDGTTVAERTIDQLSGRGRLVVASAGNEAGDRIHASTELSRGQADPVRWVADFELKPRMVDGNLIGLLFVQVWHQHEDDLRVSLRSPNGELFAPPQNSKEEFDRSVFYVECVHERARYSEDHSTSFLVVTDAESQWLHGWSLVVEEDRREGKKGVQVGAIHAWIRDQEEGSFASGSTRSHLIGMPGTAYSAITVASYATRREWMSRDPAKPHVMLDQTHLEDISYFSSPGPTRDGDTKPEIAAPGQWLIAPLSSAAGQKSVPVWTRLSGMEYAALQGTSMAAPYVSGALALLLEKDPSIDWAEAKRRLIKSARQDSFTWPCWNARWGYGKIDIEKLLGIEP